MIEKEENTSIIRATKEGRMYIRSIDFFKQKKVQDLIKKLENSIILKEIDKKHSEKIETV